MNLHEITKAVFGELLISEVRDQKSAVRIERNWQAGCDNKIDDRRLMTDDCLKVSTDTRTISKGDLFIPLVGERFDGHHFLDAAQEKGACAALVEKDYWQKVKPNLAIPVILVDDTLKALQDLAHYHRSKYNIPVIGITGSNGKTSTKDLIGAILKEKLNVVKSQGSFNNEIGLPLTLLEINSDTQAVVVEMGMRGLGQITELANIARPTMGVVTSVAPVHIDILKTIENIATAKGELPRSIDKSGKVFLNGENSWCIKMKDWTEAEVNFFGFNDSCKYHAQIIEMDLHKSRFKLKIDDQTKDMELPIAEVGSQKSEVRNTKTWDMELPVAEVGSQKSEVGNAKTCDIELPIPGEHNILNALAAIGVAYELGFDLETISQGLKSASISEKRLEKIILDSGVVLINDTYNANPTSMKASINILSAAQANRRIAVLGDMYELGDYELEGHLSVGSHICNDGADLLITIGNLGRLIAKGALDSGMLKEKVFSFENNQEAADFLKEHLSQGDIVLFKGSRAAKIEEIVRAIDN